MTEQPKKYPIIKSPSLSALIVEEIEARILRGDLKIQRRLPPERELGEQFGVSPQR